jgi:hypothetical protein
VGPGHCLSVPIGLSLSLKEPPAPQLQLPSRSRSALARAIVDCVVAQLPERRRRLLVAGGYATTEGLRGLPASVNVVSRLLIRGTL